MAHPRLVAWGKKRSGLIAIAVGNDSSYHLVSDGFGRGLLFELLTIFGEIEYQSSVEIRLELPAPERVDANLTKREPKWFTKSKLTGGGGSPLVTVTLDDERVKSLNRVELAKVLSQPNLGHNEAVIVVPEQFWIW